MKFLSNKIELICSTDTTRENLCSPYLDLSDPLKPYLVATDGHRLVALALAAGELNDGLHNKDEPQQWTDISGHIPLEALKAARKLKSWIDASRADVVRVIGGATYPRPSADLRFPDWRQVCPSPDRPEIHYGIRAKYLKDVADALGATELPLYFSAEDSADPVRVWDGDHIAVIMPVRMGSERSPALNGATIVIDGAAPAAAGHNENDQLEIANLRAEIKALKEGGGRIGEVAEMRARLDDAIKVSGANVARNTDLTAQVDRLKAENARFAKLWQDLKDQHAACAGMLKSANERAAITPDDLENENKELKDRLSELKTELEEMTAERIALEEDDSCCKDTRAEVEAEQIEIVEQAEQAAALKLESARKYLKTWPPPAWCGVCDTAAYRHAADCLVLSVLQ